MNLVMTLTIFYMLIVINAAVKSFVEFYSCICYNISIDLENKDICLLGRQNIIYMFGGKWILWLIYYLYQI